jgi:hypothetical protein
MMCWDRIGKTSASDKSQAVEEHLLDMHVLSHDRVLPY